jgi:hypothetical protein
MGAVKVVWQPMSSRFGFGRACALGLTLFVLCCAGCAGHSARTLEARSALDAHNPARALELYNKELDVEKGSELPEHSGGDNALLLLDRSMISQELGAYADSQRDLQTADKEVQMLDFTRSTADEIGRYLFSDSTGEYKARPFEKLLINTMNMVNYLAQGDLQGAKVEARRFAVMHKYLRETQGEERDAFLGPGSYLAGFVFERAGEVDEALRFYDEALFAGDYASLREPILRLSERSGYRSPRLNEVLKGAGQAASTDDSGELLVVINYGRVPALVAERVPIGLALTYASFFIAPATAQAARRMAGQGLVTWVNYPRLEGAPRNYAPPAVEVDGAMQASDQITHVDDLVRASYEKVKGQTMAAAIVRMVTRGAVGAGVGTGVAKASDNAAIGMLAALVTQATMSAVDTPDTRSWATLPARIGFVRMRLAPGHHTVRVQAQGVSKTFPVDIAPSGFAVVNFTELSQ